MTKREFMMTRDAASGWSIVHHFVILSVSEESGGRISCALSYLRSFTPPAASFRMTGGATLFRMAEGVFSRITRSYISAVDFSS